MAGLLRSATPLIPYLADTAAIFVRASIAKLLAVEWRLKLFLRR